MLDKGNIPLPFYSELSVQKTPIHSLIEQEIITKPVKTQENDNDQTQTIIILTQVPSP